MDLRVYKDRLFNSEAELMEFMYGFQRKYNHPYSIKNSKTLEKIILAESRRENSCNINLEYDEIQFACVHEGKFVTKGENKRKLQENILKRTDCEAFIQFRTTTSGKQHLRISSFHLSHNHQPDTEDFVEKHLQKFEITRMRNKEKRIEKIRKALKIKESKFKTVEISMVHDELDDAAILPICGTSSASELLSSSSSTPEIVNDDKDDNSKQIDMMVNYYRQRLLKMPQDKLTSEFEALSLEALENDIAEQRTPEKSVLGEKKEQKRNANEHYWIDSNDKIDFSNISDVPIISVSDSDVIDEDLVEEFAQLKSYAAGLGPQAFTPGETFDNDTTHEEIAEDAPFKVTMPDGSDEICDTNDPSKSANINISLVMPTMSQINQQMEKKEAVTTPTIDESVNRVGITDSFTGEKQAFLASTFENEESVEKNYPSAGARSDTERPPSRVSSSSDVSAQAAESELDLKKVQFREMRSKGRPREGRKPVMAQGKGTQKLVPFCKKFWRAQVIQVLETLIPAVLIERILNREYKIAIVDICDITAATLNDCITSDSVKIAKFKKYFEDDAFLLLESVRKRKLRSGPWKCRICDGKLQDEAIECENCLHWMDWSCQGIKSQPEGEWYCTECQKPKK